MVLKISKIYGNYQQHIRC